MLSSTRPGRRDLTTSIYIHNEKHIKPCCNKKIHMAWQKQPIIAIYILVFIAFFSSSSAAFQLEYTDNASCNIGNCFINTSYYHYEMLNGTGYKYYSYKTDHPGITGTPWTAQPGGIGIGFAAIYTTGWIADIDATNVVQCTIGKDLTENNEHIWMNCNFTETPGNDAWINYSFYPSYIKIQSIHIGPDTGGSMYFNEYLNGTWGGAIFNHSMALNGTSSATGIRWTDWDSQTGIMAYAWNTTLAPADSVMNTSAMLAIDWDENVLTDMDYGAGNVAYAGTNIGGLVIGRLTSWSNNSLLTLYMKVLNRNDSSATFLERYTDAMTSYSVDKTYQDDAPILSLTTPANNTNATNNTVPILVPLSFNVSSTRNITNCVLTINGSVNTTETDIVEEQVNSINLNFSVDTSILWSINCTDDAGFMSNTETRLFKTFVVNNLTIQISEITPDPAYYNSTLIGNCMASNIGILSYNYKWYHNGGLYTENRYPGLGYKERYDETDGGCLEAVDGNWNTYETQPICYVNYTKPANTIAALWRIKDECSETTTRIPYLGWIDHATKMVLYIDEPSGEIYWKYRQASLWVNQKYCIGSYGDGFEEGMYFVNATAAGVTIRPYNISPSLTKGDTWTFACQADDGQNLTEWKNYTITINNAIPVLSSANITYLDDVVYANTTISGSCYGSDGDSDLVSYNFSWYVNGTLNETGLLNSTTTYTNKSELLKNQNWTFSCLAYDGTNYSSVWQNSSTITVINFIPIFTNVSLVPAAPASADNISCNYTYDDADNETSVASFNWTINGVETDVHTQTLLYNWTSTYDNITCSVLLTDGNDTTNWSSSTQTTIADDIVPTISYLAINKTEGYTDEIINIYINCSDDSGIIRSGYPKLSYDSPGGSTQGNFTMVILAGSQYNYSTMFSTAGIYENFTFYCADAFDNLVINNTNNISFTSAVRPGGGASGGGGGGGQDREVIITELNLTSFCGDGICSEGENPLTCSQDCQVNLETALTCLWTDPQSCIYSESWFATFLLLFLILSGGYIMYRAETKDKQPKWMKKWF